MSKKLTISHPRSGWAHKVCAMQLILHFRLQPRMQLVKHLFWSGLVADAYRHKCLSDVRGYALYCGGRLGVDKASQDVSGHVLAWNLAPPNEGRVQRYARLEPRAALCGPSGSAQRRRSPCEEAERHGILQSLKELSGDD